MDIDPVHRAWGDKELEANEGEQLASTSLSPQAVRIGPTYITAPRFSTADRSCG